MNDPGSVTNWIEGVKQGDETAAARLWERYSQRLARLCRKRLPDFARRVGDEEDVVIEVMENLYRGAQEGRFPELQDRDDLWRLMVVVTARKTASYLRKEQALKRGGGRVCGESAIDSASTDTAGINRVEDTAERPDFAASVAEECLHRLAMLQDHQLRHIAIRKLDGHTNDEIAKELNCSVRTIERRLQSIREKWQLREEDQRD